MFDLGTNDIAVLGAGALFIVAGLAGLMPLLLHRRPSPGGRVRFEESLYPACSLAADFMRPQMAPVFDAGATPAPPSSRPVRALVHGEIDGRAGETEVPEVQDLLARLFSVRMALSDLTEEIHTLRDVYDLDDDVVEDIDKADDDLSDMDEDGFPDQPSLPMGRAANVIEAA